MRTPQTTVCQLVSLLLVLAWNAPVCFAQSASPAPAAVTATAASSQPSEAEMMKIMMEMSKLNENHKLLASMDGTWNYVVKMWMNGDPSSKPQESKGIAVRKSVMNGRYFTMDVNGKMDMPGPDGKMQSMEFHGMGTDAYDNAKKKFVGTWVDNMSTGIMMSEGDYDAATKTFTYKGEYQMTPEMKQAIRETMKMTDKDHLALEWYEDRAGKEVKTMEINYTRKK